LSYVCFSGTQIPSVEELKEVIEEEEEVGA
jgi:hypothetical protein